MPRPSIHSPSINGSVASEPTTTLKRQPLNGDHDAGSARGPGSADGSARISKPASRTAWSTASSGEGGTLGLGGGETAEVVRQRTVRRLASSSTWASATAGMDWAASRTWRAQFWQLMPSTANWVVEAGGGAAKLIGRKIGEAMGRVNERRREAPSSKLKGMIKLQKCGRCGSFCSLRFFHSLRCSNQLSPFHAAAEHRRDWKRRRDRNDVRVLGSELGNFVAHLPTRRPGLAEQHRPVGGEIFVQQIHAATRVSALRDERRLAACS